MSTDDAEVSGAGALDDSGHWARGLGAAAEAAWAVPHRRRAVAMTANNHAQAGTGRAPGLFRELQRDAVEAHDVVRADGALCFDAEQLIEIEPRRGARTRAAGPGPGA